MSSPLPFEIQATWAGLAAVAAGLINALAGGGSLLSFPALTAIGLPAVMANVTNTVALAPGYLGAAGGLVGGLLLLQTGERLFTQLVPFLILFASALLAVQEPVRRWVQRRSERRGRKPSELWAVGPVFLAAIYGGFFGGGLSVIVLAVLALSLDDTLTRLNGLKQAVSFATNLTAAGFFLFSGQVAWALAVVMAIGAIVGGALGGKVAGRVPPATLRIIVVVVGVAVALSYLFKG